MTARQLLWMADGKRKDAWYHTAAIIAKVHNVNCSKKSELKKPTAFHPYMQQKASKVTGKISVAQFTDFVVSAMGDSRTKPVEQPCHPVPSEPAQPTSKLLRRTTG